MKMDLVQVENDWWDDFCVALDGAEKEARAAAEASADLWEFDSEEEREAYIEEVYEDRLAELLGN
jgi:hypothetical protein